MHKLQFPSARDGHTEFAFDPKNDAQVAEAMKKFETCLKEGKVAGVRMPNGECKKVTAFDPTAEATVFFDPLVGG